MSREIKRSEPTDSEVILGILNGSKDVLERLYKAYFPMILQLVVMNNGTEDEAKDVFQESVIVLYDKVQSGNFELSSKLKTFIYSVCRRLWLKRLTYKSRNSGSIQDYEETLPVEEDIEQHEEKDRLFKQMETALVHLGEPCRTIIEDYYINNKSMQEICVKFGYTNADNAKNQKYKCLQRLKKIFFSDSK
ncbi:RNA polymerase sigma factor (sigma-70 family) [Arcticibacter tournemirensis]|uniref:Sigma-70 family RNA polymerase sigma factor n=1 Tax=Arcticibacter tournemirensis TaxID=699437 RepID=A0A5M9HCH0_9SPHI|nr:sigma-70 family RNA polymerase sigma factor [Arcticibacter tournemirensis]KAA8484159.1 sigma-70 family RNA polymerase sigma factor [Arcticibacter tournemirensis]TQM51904.1 RNA polymerase sigma factor (sigma-70 family) [Arcticibacter tournemirensis]